MKDIIRQIIIDNCGYIISITLNIIVSLLLYIIYLKNKIEKLKDASKAGEK